MIHRVIPAAIVFDFDGVIVDSEVAELASWHEAYEVVGLAFPEDRWIDTVGRAASQGGGSFDPYAELELASGTPRSLLRERRHARVLQLVDAGPTLPGVVDLLAAAHQAGVRLGVASSSVHAWIDYHLAARDLLRYFDCVVSAEDVGGIGKPAPDVYVEALRRLAVRPRNAVAIEDSPNGIAAARSAGLFTLAVPNHITRSLPLAHADLTVASLAEVSIAHLAGWIRGRSEGRRTRGTRGTRVPARPDQPT